MLLDMAGEARRPVFSLAFTFGATAPFVLAAPARIAARLMAAFGVFVVASRLASGLALGFRSKKGADGLFLKFAEDDAEYPGARFF